MSYTFNPFSGTFESSSGGSTVLPNQIIPDWVTDTDYEQGNLVLKNRDIYLCQTDHHSGNFDTDIANGLWVGISPTDGATGITSGLDLENGPQPNQIKVTKGIGIFIDSYTTAAQRSYKRVNLLNDLVMTVTTAINQAFSVLMNDQGVVSIIQGIPDQDQVKYNVIIGTGALDNAGNVSFLNNTSWTVGITDSKIENIILQFGLIRNGLTVHPNNGTTTLSLISGSILAFGANPGDRKYPNTKSIGTQNPFTFKYALASSLLTNNLTNIDVTSYEPDGLGALAPVPAGQFTIQKIYFTYSGAAFFQYGQKVYNTLLNARADIYEPTIGNAVLTNRNIFQNIAYIIVKQGATDTGDKTQVEVGNGGIFGVSSVSTALASQAPGDVFGPNLSDDNAIARFDQATGKIIQNSGVIIDDTNNIAGVVKFTSTGDMTVDTDSLFVDSVNHRIGMNTLVPYTNLDVLGNIYTTIHGSTNMHNAAEVGVTSIGMKSGNTGDGFTGIKLNVKALDSAGAAVANNSDIQFWTWGNGISVSREVARFTERGRLGVGTTNPIDTIQAVGNIRAGGTAIPILRADGNTDGQVAGTLFLSQGDAYGAKIYYDATNTKDSMDFVLRRNNVETTYMSMDSGSSLTYFKQNMSVDSGIYIRFPHANQSDPNDGKIGAKLFDEGLNIIGVQTVAAGGRAITSWADGGFTINEAPSKSLALSIASTTGAFLPPRMTTAQRDAIAAIVNGMQIYNTTTNTMQARVNGVWADMATTTPSINYNTVRQILRTVPWVVQTANDNNANFIANPMVLNNTSINGAYVTNGNWAGTVYLPAADGTIPTGTPFYFLRDSGFGLTVKKDRTDMANDLSVISGGRVVFIYNANTALYEYQGMVASNSVPPTWNQFNSRANSFNLPTGRGNNTEQLTSNGAGAVTWSGAASTKAFKKDIKPLVDFNEIFEKLNPVTFHWNQHGLNYTLQNNELHYGFIKEETEKILPGAVKGKGIIYDEITAILVAKIKSLEQRIEKLEKKH